jgi:hypothetical protein
MRSELDKSAEDDRGVVLARFVSELNPDDEALLRSLLGGTGDAAGLDEGARLGEGSAVGDAAGGGLPGGGA